METAIVWPMLNSCISQSLRKTRHKQRRTYSSKNNEDIIPRKSVSLARISHFHGHASEEGEDHGDEQHPRHNADYSGMVVDVFGSPPVKHVHDGIEHVEIGAGSDGPGYSATEG